MEGLGTRPSSHEVGAGRMGRTGVAGSNLVEEELGTEGQCRSEEGTEAGLGSKELELVAGRRVGRVSSLVKSQCWL